MEEEEVGVLASVKEEDQEASEWREEDLSSRMGGGGRRGRRTCKRRESDQCHEREIRVLDIKVGGKSLRLRIILQKLFCLILGFEAFSNVYT